MADRPLVHAELVREWLGQEAYDELMRKHHKPQKIPKHVESDIAKHYRTQLAAIEDMRKSGWRGYIELEDWDGE
jgi:hypothetical protein